MEHLYDLGKINDNIKLPSGIRNPDHFQIYLKKRLRQKHDYLHDWLELLTENCLRFQNPAFVNLNQFEEYPKFAQGQKYNENFWVNLLMTETTAISDRRYGTSNDYKVF